ncbi:hypothetical protein BGZ61DRAFT_495572 [Ilyonectria robusta]|uniref:uncharacterized protein n=1 Tax=Ilyonectria robusta TaxID=1079257 RepID=UPI001E8DD7FD|nr:uncharacterized protein BGZ61DRAFT_495572 [Ilyonectria robusta]KAH8683828.1 hypothetical protein BGZ61DRAFT_495572 [Ilyonectria robusta]
MCLCSPSSIVGIQVSSNSSLILRKLGVDKYILPFTTEPVDLKMMRWQDGKVLVQCPLKKPALEEYGSPYWHIHRADLHRGLLECATDLGITLHLDSKVLDVDLDYGSLVTSKGEKLTADFIVASDGLHSTCRSIVVGKPMPPVPTGQMVFRVTVPASELKDVQGLGDLATTPRNNHWIGPRATILSYLLEGINDTLVNFVFTCDVDLGSLEDGVNQKKGTSEDVRKAFKNWDPRIDKILEHVTEVLEWRLYTHQEAPSWIHPSNKMCLIGDAAHAMTPYLAQGAAVGFEDAAVLGGVLEKCSFTKDLPAALQLYQRLRLKRSARVATASIESRWFTQMEDGPEQEKRDEWLLAHPGIWPNHINIRSRKEFLDELFGYDAYRELEAAFQEGGFEDLPEKLDNHDSLSTEQPGSATTASA